jgi:hypothetical protein
MKVAMAGEAPPPARRSSAAHRRSAVAFFHAFSRT